MAVLPQSRAEMIQWFADRVAIWNANAAALNLSPSQITSLASALSTADTKKQAAFVARNQSEAATFEYHNEADELRDLGALFIKIIKTHAEATNNPNVLALANIPEPAKPVPLGPAEQPTNVVATLGSFGQVNLKWDGTRRGGTSFNIWRSTAVPGSPATSFTLIGTSEERKFTDNALPTGLATATYHIVASRTGGNSSPSDPTVVYFGSGASSFSSQPASAGTSAPELTIAA